MTDLQKTIEYVFKLSNDISAQAGQASQTLDEANAKVVEFERGQERVNSASSETAANVRRDADTVSSQSDRMVEDMREAKRQSEQIDMIASLTTLMGLRESVSAVTGGIIGLGIVSDETAQDLQKVNAGFSLIAGAVTGIKSLQAVMTTLNATEAAGAVITSIRTAMSSPLGIVAVGAGLGAAAGVAGALLMTSNSTTNNSTNITVQDTTPKQATDEIYRVVAGGAL